MSTEFSISTLPNVAFNNCIGRNGSTNHTTDEPASTDAVLQSTVSFVIFNNLTNCSVTEEGHTTPADSISNYAEYVFAVTLNKYYVYFVVGFGVSGNLAALITICSMKPFASSFVYMAMLAFSDLTYLVVKFTYYLLSANDIRVFDVGCKFIMYFGTLTMHLSSWTLSAFTIERSIIVWFPLKVSQICTKKKAVFNVVVIATILMGLNSHFFWTTHEEYHPYWIWWCPYKKQYAYFIENIWYWIDSSVYGLIPVIIIAIFNVFIIIGINMSAKKQKELMNKTTNDKLRQHRQITLMSITVSIVFLILTSPNCIIFIYREFWDYKSSYQEFARYYLIYKISFVLVDVNHSVNFYLYFLTGKKFRDKFKEMFCCPKNKCNSPCHKSLSRNNCRQDSTTSEQNSSKASRNSLGSTSTFVGGTPDVPINNTPIMLKDIRIQNGQGISNGHI